MAAEALDQRGQALLASERYDDAVAAFESLVERYPDSELVPSVSARRAIAAFFRVPRVQASRGCEHSGSMSALDTLS